ncbi:MAG TPA: alpha/beta fold hydrolase [Kiritimatiellia bacterium]|nr:alpha/beta fold hydrolase [Kiritimatiellia bacterium]
MHEPGSIRIPGELVSLPARGLKRPLDGFWTRGRRRADTLLLFVHGMGGNFYRSLSKKEMLTQGPRAGIDVLSFNNRGYERDVAYEVFTECRHDLDAALAFGRAQGYRRFVLLGHSTGCQKITYYQHLRRAPDVAALVLAAIGDDYAIARRDLGARYDRWIRTARDLVKKGRGDTILAGKGCLGFSACRFLSVADPKQVEARLFHMDGPLREFAAIRTPTLAVLPGNEEFACLPVPEMARRLQAVSRAQPFAVEIIPGADHGFHGVEADTTRRILRWLNALPA